MTPTTPSLRYPLLPALLALLLLAAPVRAVEVVGLYQAEAPVAGQEATQRTEAIRDAFRQVLVKVSGNAQIAARPELAGAIRDASRYVQQYSYRLLEPVEPAEPVEPPAGESPVPTAPDRVLQVVFDGVAVERLLRDQGLPVWSSNRPGVLFWGGIEIDRQRRLLNPEQDEALRQQLVTSAERRGLPLLFPLLDLEDQGRMQVADLWGGFDRTLRGASERYGADLILTGTLERVSDRLWRGSWRLLQGEQVVAWQNQGGSGEAVLDDGVIQAADRLAERFAPLAADFSLGRTRLRIGGVESLAAYAAVSRLLASQGGVERVVLVAVEPDAVTFDLQGRGGIDALEQGLQLGRLIEADPEAPLLSDDEFARGVDLYYRMR